MTMCYEYYWDAEKEIKINIGVNLKLEGDWQGNRIIILTLQLVE